MLGEVEGEDADALAGQGGGRGGAETGGPAGDDRRTVSVELHQLSSWVCGDRAGGLLGERAADHHALDLVGALEDLHDLGLAHVALDREVAGVAVAAEHLHGVGGDLHGVVGGDQLGDRRLGRERQPLVLEPRRREVRRPRGLDRGGHVGQHEREALVLDDRLAEGLALAGVGDGVVERALGEPGGDGGDAEPAGVEPGQRDLEPLALLAEQPVGVDPDVVEAHGRGGAAGQAHLPLGRVGREALGVGGHEEAGDAVAARRPCGPSPCRSRRGRRGWSRPWRRRARSRRRRAGRVVRIAAGSEPACASERQ